MSPRRFPSCAGLTLIPTAPVAAAAPADDAIQSSIHLPTARYARGLSLTGTYASITALGRRG